MYERLVAYRKEHGDTKVPYTYHEDPQLGKWVSVQRGVYKRNHMSAERANLLNSIGFDWGIIQHSTWNEMYQRLVRYQEEHNGDTNVPFRYEQDPQLGRWVHKQRHIYKIKKLSTERAALLNSIGFLWAVKP